MLETLREAWAARKAPIIAGVTVLLVIGFTIWLGGERKEAATQAVTIERAQGLETTLNRMEAADDTRREIRDDRSRARYDECVRSARNPENCQRFLPE